MIKKCKLYYLKKYYILIKNYKLYIDYDGCAK